VSKTLLIISALLLTFQGVSLVTMKKDNSNTQHPIKRLHNDELVSCADSTAYYEQVYLQIATKAINHRVLLITQGYKSLGGNTESAYFRKFIKQYKSDGKRSMKFMYTLIPEKQVYFEKELQGLIDKTCKEVEQHKKGSRPAKKIQREFLSVLSYKNNKILWYNGFFSYSGRAFSDAMKALGKLK